MKNAGRETSAKISSSVLTIKSAPASDSDTSAPRESGARLSISSRRQRERVRILISICRAIDRHVEQGKPASRQFRKFARRWRGAFYRSDSARPFQLSAERLRKIYYGRWLRSGRDPQALHHRYGANTPRFALTAKQRRQVRTLLASCVSMRQLHHGIFPRAARRPSDAIFRRCFTAAERQHLRSVFLARRQSRTSERRFARWAADSQRSFALKKGAQ